MKTQRSIGKWNRTEIKMYLFVSNSLLQFKAWVKIVFVWVGLVWAGHVWVVNLGVSLIAEFRH